MTVLDDWDRAYHEGQSSLAQSILDKIDRYVQLAHQGKITNILEDIKRECTIITKGKPKCGTSLSKDLTDRERLT
jgi:hypothetical protein